jgi:hypothetical protein
MLRRLKGQVLKQRSAKVGGPSARSLVAAEPNIDPITHQISTYTISQEDKNLWPN